MVNTRSAVERVAKMFRHSPEFHITAWVWQATVKDGRSWASYSQVSWWRGKWTTYMWVVQGRRWLVYDANRRDAPVSTCCTARRQSGTFLSIYRLTSERRSTHSDCCRVQIFLLTYLLTMARACCWRPAMTVARLRFATLGATVKSKPKVTSVVKFCTHVGYVKSQRKDKKSPLKGAWPRVKWLTLNFDVPNNISETAEARIVKFCTQLDCIKSEPMVTNHP